METISDRLQKLRKAHGLSQKDLAEGLGKSPQMMSHLLGQADPPLDFVREFCAYLREPFYRAIMSAEELSALSGVDPVIAPIVEELNHATGYPKTIQAHLFGGILAQLKKSRELVDSGEWR